MEESDEQVQSVGQMVGVVQQMGHQYGVFRAQDKAFTSISSNVSI